MVFLLGGGVAVYAQLKASPLELLYVPLTAALLPLLPSAAAAENRALLLLLQQGSPAAATANPSSTTNTRA